MSKIAEVNEKIAEAVVSGYKKIEDGVVGGYKKVDNTVVLTKDAVAKIEEVYA